MGVSYVRRLCIDRLWRRGMLLAEGTSQSARLESARRLRGESVYLLYRGLVSLAWACENMGVSEC